MEAGTKGKTRPPPHWWGSDGAVRGCGELASVTTQVWSFSTLSKPQTGDGEDSSTRISLSDEPHSAGRARGAAKSRWA